MASEERSFTDAHQAALELDVAILEQTLRRHSNAHKRTKYFQRTKMAIKHFRKMELGTVWATTKSAQGDWNKWKRIRARKDTMWDMTQSEPQDPLAAAMDAIIEKCTQVLVCTSRIEYATESIYPEIGRGFFLPLLSVVLGALARIRFLLLRLNTEIVSSFYRLEIQTISPSHAQQLVTFLDSASPKTSNHKGSAVESIMLKLGLSGFPKQMKNDGVAVETTNSSAIPARSEGSRIKGRIAPKQDVGKPVVGGSVTQYSESNSDKKHVLVDNDEALEMFKDKKRKAKNKELATSKKSKKKKSKKEKRDFFDDLFG